LETLDAIDGLKDKLKYELDMLFVDEREFWPTWTYLPKFSKKVEQLRMIFRVHGVKEKFPWRRSYEEVYN